MFSRLGALSARRPLPVVLVWVVLATAWLSLAVVGVGGQSLFDRLSSGEPVVPGAESDDGRRILESEQTTSESLTLLVTGLDLTDAGTVADAARAMNTFRANALGVQGTAGVSDPFQAPDGLTDPVAAPLVSAEGDGFLVRVDLAADLTEGVRSAAHDDVLVLLQDLPGDIGDGAEGIVSTDDLLVEAVISQLEDDLKRGELVALPLSLLIMVVVFGGFLAAGVPLIGALASIAGGLGALFGFSYLLDLDSSVVNVVTVMGLGLSIDYGLLIVSRYREELRAAVAAELETTDGGRRRRRRERGDPAVRRALQATMTTAGRTVTFSAVIVAISIGGLMVMRPEILRAIGAAGISVVAIALATGLTLVPALLGLMGRRLMRPPLLGRVPGVRALVRRLGDVAPEHGVFSRLAGLVQRRPWVIVVLATAALLVLASPLLSTQLRNSTTELIPRDSDQRTFVDVLADDYPLVASPAATVLVGTDDAEGLTAQIEQLPDVVGVDPPSALGEDYVTIGVRADTDDLGGEVATDLVREIRDLRSSGDEPEYWVLGQAATQKDFVDAMAQGAPWAAGIVVLAIFVLLFLMTGSLLVPLKALVVNGLSLAAGLGVTAWIFAEGHLEGLLGFTSVGGLESYVIAIVVSFGFGLAMDYEVFLLARIKERYDAGETNDESVRNGLQRTGRIITSAALVIIVVFAGFASGELLVIKQVGLALALTVLIDATLVRILLVPATMSMLGTANWWAPRPLRRLHARFALRH